ncbi:hypothetical protein SPRG_22241 [Saprolegnia parasitica CBS 223.65]|uniref:Tubulin delta chain n=1 Tax=Saprolegnia parasitica (strain CBS 223.65) TaxID=695850 RepID=A0A067C3Y9_SAPPC|nr:hypothetical protein SPRG_22241 [Saprolegnia parasitica CBS 223.65]KDO25198.1 hypothetical protein SPRG_22241 [Saprolegnia parasitica CBS 223.65]|eukprot:XP_012204127.1 hypothetical protein SPRG_22241 [Saprolegnia parasitica CBS 223.65]
MSISLCIGQCGNQVGAELLALSQHGVTADSQSHRPCILVDSEPKVVSAIADRVAGVHVEQSGRGNNWAMGYHQTTNVALTARVLESLRKEIEPSRWHWRWPRKSTPRGDSRHVPQGVHSNGCIAPSLVGDSPLQNYNALFTLRHLQMYSDAILYKDNDDVARLVAHWRGATGGVSLTEMNRLVAGDWAGLFLPSDKRPFDLGSFVTQTCPMATVKFVDVRTAYYTQRPRFKPSDSRLVALLPSTDDAAGLAAATKQLVASYPYPATQSPCIGRSIHVRGGATAASLTSVVKAIERAFPAPNWTEQRIATTVSMAPPVATSGAVTVSANGQTNAIPMLSTFVSRAAQQLHAKAYLHWYKKYGVEEDYFHETLDACLDVVDAYASFV